MFCRNVEKLLCLFMACEHMLRLFMQNVLLGLACTKKLFLKSDNLQVAHTIMLIADKSFKCLYLFYGIKKIWWHLGSFVIIRRRRIRLKRYSLRRRRRIREPNWLEIIKIGLLSTKAEFTWNTKPSPSWRSRGSNRRRSLR